MLTLNGRTWLGCGGLLAFALAGCSDDTTSGATGNGGASGSSGTGGIFGSSGTGGIFGSSGGAIGSGGNAPGGAGTGGSAGSSTGGSAGSSAGGSAGSSTGGSAGSSTGGSAGSSTGGSAGSGTGGGDAGVTDSGTPDASDQDAGGHCGNSKVDVGEDCDDGNEVTGDGCENDCHFSCVNAADCPAAPACRKQSCTAAHVCAPVADPTLNGSASGCAAGNVCLNGACAVACGNGAVNAGEQCDDANANNGDGCDNDCTFSCANPATDCAGNAGACSKWSCNPSHTCAPAADTSLNGTSCGSGKICHDGACGDSCGDGVTDTALGEECDFGAGNNGAGTGCEANCKTSCHTTPSDSCNDGNACNGVEACNAVTVNQRAGKKCSPGTQASKCTACSAGVCSDNGACIAATCGDGCTSGTEQCDPPNTNTCGATCQSQCDITGNWAAYLEVNVTWTGSLLNSGSGKIRIWSLITTTQSGSTTTNSVLPCNVQIPSFTSILNVTGSIAFPLTLFDHSPPYLPATTMTATLSGNTYSTSAPFTSLLGMNAPASGAWPAAPSGITQVDQDQDGTGNPTNRPGITGIPTNVPVAVLGANADEAYLAIRQRVTSVTGTITNCNSISGSAVVASMDSHVLGCHVGNNFCNATQATFVDDHRPIYTPVAGANQVIFKAVKLTGASTCAAVRGTTFP